MHIKSKAGTALVIAAMAAMFLSPAPANAAGSSAAPLAKGNVGFTASSQAAVAAAEYWTPERMASAKPDDLDVAGRPSAGLAPDAKPQPSGKQVSYPPTAGLLGQAGGSTPDTVTAQSTAVPRPYDNPPDRLNGKVFFDKYTAAGVFVDHFVCSGTSVNSPGLSLVWTAGHCIHGGPGYGVHRNWVFVPAYSSTFLTEAPYGTWPAKELWTKSAWVTLGDFSYDVAGVIVWRVGGKRLTEKIGGQGIWFNASAVQNYTSFGYPAAPPFTGYLQYQCASPWIGLDFPGSGPPTNAILCDMTGGSSGGGWLINMVNGWGYVNSVNSYKYPSDPNTMYGPYHGDAALNLWDFVKNKTA